MVFFVFLLLLSLSLSFCLSFFDFVFSPNQLLTIVFPVITYRADVIRSLRCVCWLYIIIISMQGCLKGISETIQSCWFGNFLSGSIIGKKERSSRGAKKRRRQREREIEREREKEIERKQKRSKRFFFSLLFTHLINPFWFVVDLSLFQMSARCGQFPRMPTGN